MQRLKWGGGVEKDRKCKGNAGCGGTNPSRRTLVRVDAVDGQDSISATTVPANGVIAVRAINRGIDAVHADKEGMRAAMIKWSGLSPEMVGKIGYPLFEKGLAEKDLQVTIDLSAKYKLIPRPIKARDVISEIAK